MIINLLLFNVFLALVMAIGWLLIKLLWKRKSSIMGAMGAVASWISKGYTTETSPRTQPEPRTSEPKPLPALQMRVKVVSMNALGQPTSAFLVEIKGRKPGPRAGSAVAFYLHIFDMESLTPVHVAGSSHTEIDGVVFQFTRHTHQLGGGEGYSDWREIAKIPASQLSFPWKGQRSFQFRLIAMGTANGLNSFSAGNCLTGTVNETYRKLKKEFQYVVPSFGYLDQIEFDQEEVSDDCRTWILSTELAIYVANVDGVVAQAERETVRGWAEKKLASIDSSRIRQATKRQINVSIDHSEIKVRSRKTDLSSICSSLGKCSEVERLQALTLCIDVAKADKKATTAEFTVLNKINKELVLPREKYSQYREWINKWILDLGVKGIRPIRKVVLLDVAFGVVPKKERNTRLTRAAAFWNGLTVDDREEVRKVAEKMMDIIGDIRYGYDDDE